MDKASLREQNARTRTLLNEIQQSLPYQLGGLLLQLRHPGKWIDLPDALRKLSLARRLNVSGDDLQRYAKSAGLRKSLAEAPATALFQLVPQIAGELSWSAAAEFAAKYGRPGYENATSLITANLSLNDDDGWLSALNAYIKPFGLLPLKLSNGSGSKFDRLEVDVTKYVKQGDLITVIMPAFNAEKTVRKAAESILSQTWSNLELIIVDDCSTDSTWEIIQSLAVVDPRVKPVRNVVNVGPYVCKNLALRLVKGKYLTGHDADDWAHPERLENDIAVILESGGRVRAVLSAMLRMNPAGEFSRFNRIGPFSQDGVSRVAAISLLTDVEYFREFLGAWDSVRFSADGELIGRAQKIMGNQFVAVHHIGMIGLDLPSSLSNDPLHGVSNINGKSRTRRAYSDEYRAWHRKIRINTAKLAFPPDQRPFRAPEAMIVSANAIQKNIAFNQEQLSNNSSYVKK